VENPQTTPNDKPQPIPDNFDEMLEKKLNAKLEEKELNSLDYSDELKTNVKAYAKANNMSISEAIKSPYMDFLKSEEDKKARTEDASLGNKRRAPSSSDLTKVDPTNFDMSTDDGRKQ
jgi:hypothetical protein